MRGIAEASGVSVSTISRLVDGLGNPKPRTMRRLAETLGVDMSVIYAGIGRRAPGEPWAPEAGRLLRPEERDALERVVRLLTAGREDAPESMGNTNGRTSGAV